MQFTREDSNEANTIVAYAEGEVRLRDHAYTSSLIVTRTEILDGWRPASANALSIADFSALIALKPEIVLLGTGARLRFPHPRLTAALTRARIGLEVMDVQAACRTYNILMAEERKVAAALLFA